MLVRNLTEDLFIVEYINHFSFHAYRDNGMNTTKYVLRTSQENVHSLKFTLMKCLKHLLTIEKESVVVLFDLDLPRPEAGFSNVKLNHS